MRIKTDGTHEYRLLRRVMQRTGESTKSGAFDFATEYTPQMLDAIEADREQCDHCSALSRSPGWSTARAR